MKTTLKHKGQKKTIEDKALFDALVARVQACRLCSRMEGRRRVLGYANGSPDANVLFVAEAPGRLGAERDGKPLWGDRTGKNFRRLLRLSGLKRSEIFISNAVLCNPQNNDGNNSPPTTREIKNCSMHMKSLLNIMRPKMVVTLGRKALQSLNEVSTHEIDLRRDVATPAKWHGTNVVPLYHCGQQAMISRPFDKQKEDYKKLKRILTSKGSTGLADKLPLLSIPSPSTERGRTKFRGEVEGAITSPFILPAPIYRRSLSKDNGDHKRSA